MNHLQLEYVYWIGMEITSASGHQHHQPQHQGRGNWGLQVCFLIFIFSTNDYWLFTHRRCVRRRRRRAPTPPLQHHPTNGLQRPPLANDVLFKIIVSCTRYLYLYSFFCELTNVWFLGFDDHDDNSQLLPQELLVWSKRGATRPGSDLGVWGR